MVIDDDPSMLTLMSTLLRVDGFEVSTAINGEKGIALARDLVPDVILLDVMMPRIDGFEVCRRLRALAETRHACIILVTARATSADRVEGLRAGADDFITKPFDPEELLERVRSVLERRRETATAEIDQVDAGSEELTLLVVDDNRMIREILTTYCEAKGFTVFEAKNGVDAYHSAKKHRPRFVVLDFRMPELDGRYAAELLREVVPDATLIALSAFLDAKPEWADVFIQKHQLAELPALLQELIEARRGIR
jgi:DNA-binding response OmpR family regulator